MPDGVFYRPGKLRLLRLWQCLEDGRFEVVEFYDIT